jgi:hypothetical protein
MESFALLVGHMLGDYILQNDWMAANKANPSPGAKPGHLRTCEGGGFVYIAGEPAAEAAYAERWHRWVRGETACLAHCLLYTLAVALCCFWFMPAEAVLAVGVLHYPMDRYRLARLWMTRVSGQRAFAETMGPWSVIAVDNTIHLLVLFAAGLYAAGGR